MKADYARLLAELDERRLPTYGDTEALLEPRFQTIRSSPDIGIDGNREGARPDAAKQAEETRKAKEPSSLNGYLIKRTSETFCFWGVSKEDGSRVPDALSGVFTSLAEARNAVLTYGGTEKAKPESKSAKSETESTAIRS
jgi:hypothetical protein